MKRLVLLRHAKSQRDEATKDKDRPLNERGRGDAPRMGSYMHHKSYLPQLVLCSPAKRTVETWELLAPELGVETEVRFPDPLYLASAAAIGKLVKAVGSEVSLLVVIGHNPGLEDFAHALARKPESAKERKLDAEIRAKFPTGALAVLDFQVNAWSEIAPGDGELVDFARPKGLDGDQD